MDLMSIMMIYVFVMMVFVVFVFMSIIAGKDIIMAIKRFFLRKGCDVYIANPNRNIDKHYIVPKRGNFYINKILYVTNPNKLENLKEEDKIRVIESLTNRRNRIKKRIITFENKKILLQNMANNVENEVQKSTYLGEVERLNAIIEELNNALNEKNNNYYKDRRPAFFYNEGDPIPINFYDYKTEYDSDILDNLVSLAATKPTQNDAIDLKKQFATIKLLVMILVGCCVIAAYLAFRNNGVLMDICANQGWNCALR